IRDVQVNPPSPSQNNGKDPSSPSSSVNILPHDLEKEKMILAALLQAPDAAIISQLNKDDFWSPDHQTIFKAIRDIVNQALPLDFWTLRDFLKRPDISLGQLEEFTNYAPREIGLYHISTVKKLTEQRAVMALVWKAQQEPGSFDIARLESELVALKDGSGRNEGPSEIGLEINAEALRQEVADKGGSSLTMLPLLGQEKFFVKGWSHMLAGYPRAGKTELMIRAVTEWPGEKILYLTEEAQNLWEARLETLPERYRLEHVTLF